ncbi:MAG: hypothetical protein P8P36_09880 [Akkermansiaceae bacterium]|nr:hypothetical protein [Akkermansiaceae bacterium]
MSFSLYNLSFAPSLFTLCLGIGALLWMAILCLISIKRSARPKRTSLLELLRFTCTLIVVLMLWEPEWRTITEPTSKPEIIILYDASTSTETNDAILPASLSSPQGVVSRREWIEQVLSSESFISLKEDDKNRVIELPFSAPPQINDPVAQSLAGTDIFSAIEKTLENHDNIRAIVLLTDGDWNTGTQPVAAAQMMRRRQIPLFGIPVGSDRRLPDLDISNVTSPTYGIIGENVQIPFTITSSLSRDVRTTIRLRDINTGKERTKSITIPAGKDYYDSVLWRLNTEGTSTLEISIPVSNGELVETNNKQEFTISGRREAIKALVIETQPRWEYRFIRNALYRDPGVQVDCLLLHPDIGVGKGPGYIDQFPEKLEDLQKYDVVFIGDVGISENPREGITLDQAALLKGLIENQASGIVFLPGPAGNMLSLTQSPLGELIPVILDEKQKSGYGGAISSKLNLTTNGSKSLLTMLGDTEEDNPGIWKNLPGFNWHAPIIKAKGGTDVLAVHADKSNQYGRIPLLVTSMAGNGKVLFLGHDSAWKWRRGVEDLYHYRFWGQVARWMSYQRNMAAGSRIRLYFTPERPKPGDSVSLSANAFDQYGSPLKQGDVFVDIQAPDRQTQRISLNKEDLIWGSYSGRFKITQPGAWNIRATIGQDSAHSTDTTLIAQGRKIEKTGMPARIDVIEEMSRVAKGQLLEGAALQNIDQEISSLPRPKALISRAPLWSHWITAASLILLLACFWIGRKLNGTF